MKPYIEKENDFFVVYDRREYQSSVVNIPLLRTKNKSEAELMLKYLTEA